MKGQRLFTISSLDLQRDVANGLKPVSTSSYRIDAVNGQVTFVAQMAGTVTDLEAQQGTFVAGGDMATITTGGTQYVAAEFRLTPDQYARIRIGGKADVELPNRTRMPASVSDVSVETSQGVAVTTVKLTVPRLQTDGSTVPEPAGQPGVGHLDLGRLRSAVGSHRRLHELPAPGGSSMSWQIAARAAAPLVLMILLAACEQPDGDSSAEGDADGASSTAPLPAATIAPVARSLPQRTTAALPTMRLAAGLTPPTNRWFSGLVFGDTPQPVFPLPLAFSLTDHGFGFGLPQVVASATAVVGSHQQDVEVSVAGQDDQVVSAYDDASFTLSSRDTSGRGDSDGPWWPRARPSSATSRQSRETLQTSVAWRKEQDFWAAITPTGTYALVVRHGSVERRHHPSWTPAAARCSFRCRRARNLRRWRNWPPQ